MGSGGDAGLERGTLEVAGVRRSYWLARSRETPAGRGPLLIMLHGSGTTGRDVATTVTGLASRGPAAGVTVVFPDGWRGALSWSGAGCPAVVVYRTESGGHGWPGGPQDLPVRARGPIPRQLDATGILLDMVTAGAARA